MDSFEISGSIVDVVSGTIKKGSVRIQNGRIKAIEPQDQVPDVFIVPGLVDAHVHIESSMLVPTEFARLAVAHGTVATVSDPHEIANVLGLPGVQFMLDNAAQSPFKFYFGAPSCVPATGFETAGAILGPAEVEKLLEDPRIKYLSEMMNFPGVLSKDPEVMAKIAIAKKLGKPIDGHAPGLTGGSARAYAEAGMTTDHECTTSVEARDKLEVGMKIIIREGSAAKNFDALINLIRDYPSQIMFCSDDKHPNDLVVGHIDQLVRRALALEFNPIDVLRAATLNPIRHYGLDVGLLQPGDSADFIVVDSLRSFSVLSTFIGGVEVARLGDSMLPHRTSSTINNFQLNQIQAAELEVLCGSTELRAIEVIDGQLLTNCAVVPSRQHLGKAISDPDQDLLKLVVCNRYQSAPLSIAFVKGFGLRAGAVASSVAHDSHNLIAVGVDDLSIARALQMVAGSKGGIAAVGPAGEKILPLPVAGLMSIEDGYEVAQAYEAIDRFAKSLGSSLQAPFMTLSFLALPVIPRLKLTDKGLFDSDEFDFVPIFV